MSLNGNLPK